MGLLDRVNDARLPARRERGELERYSLSDLASWMSFQGHQYALNGQNTLGYTTTYGKNIAEPIADSFAGYVNGALKSNGIISAIEQVRISVFAEARFQFQRFNNGRPGDMFGTPALNLLEHPWPGGTTGDLMARMLLDADFAGSAYPASVDGEIVRLRPDWVEIILEPRMVNYGPDGQPVPVGMRKVGFFYYEGGKQTNPTPAVFLPDEVGHFAPYPDPLATYRGMSWLTPVIREIQADGLATTHKKAFFENAATPNVAVSLAKEITPAQFEAFVEKMDREHKGAESAYKTLYTAGGADVTVIGADMKQLDFKVTQGAGETRLAAAAGVHPVIVGLSEGMQGSSLNAGNFGAARRRFADGTMRPLWRNAAGSLETLVPPPPGSRLWVDTRDIGFLREDEKDSAEIAFLKAQTIRQYLDAGFDPDAAVAAVTNGDENLLAGKHGGLFSVQLQAPGANTNDPAQGGQ